MRYTKQDMLENSVLSDALEHVELFITAVNISQITGFNCEMLQEFYGKAAFLNSFVKQNLLNEDEHFEVYAIKDAEEREAYFEMLEVLHRIEFVMNVISKEIAKAFF